MDVVERQPSSGDVSIGLQTLGANGVAIRTRYDFLEKLCTAFMAYGAPTHRLEGMFFFLSPRKFDPNADSS